MQKIFLNVPENMLKFELSAQMPVRRYVMAPRYSWEHKGYFLENVPQNCDFVLNITNHFMIKITIIMLHYKQNSFMFVLCKG